MLVLFFTLFIAKIPTQGGAIPKSAVSSNQRASLPVVASGVPGDTLVRLARCHGNLCGISVRSSGSS